MPGKVAFFEGKGFIMLDANLLRLADLAVSNQKRADEQPLDPTSIGGANAARRALLFGLLGGAAAPTLGIGGGLIGATSAPSGYLGQSAARGALMGIGGGLGAGMGAGLGLPYGVPGALGGAALGGLGGAGLTRLLLGRHPANKERKAAAASRPVSAYRLLKRALYSNQAR